MITKNIDHLNLSVRDFDETADWYGRVFGFEVVERGEEPEGRWGVLRAGDALLCVYERRDFVFEDARGKGVHGMAHFGLRVTDRDAWERTVAREDLEVAYGGAIDYPHSTSWYVKDPTGWGIEVALWNNDTIAFD